MYQNVCVNATKCNKLTVLDLFSDMLTIWLVKFSEDISQVELDFRAA